MADRLWRITFEGTLASGALVRNSSHWHESTELLEDFASGNDVADQFYTYCGAQYLACCPSDYHLTQVVAREVVRYWAPFLEVPEVGAKSASAIGGISPGTDRPPNGLTGKISFKSSAAVRGGHGWMLLPGSPDATNLSSAGLWEGAYTGALATLATKLGASFSWGTLPSHELFPVVYSETRHRAAAESYWFDVVSATATNKPSWLKRRMTVP